MSLNPLSSEIVFKQKDREGKYDFPIENELRSMARTQAAQALLCEPSDVPSFVEQYVTNLATTIFNSLPPEIKKSKDKEERHLCFHRTAQAIISPYIIVKNKVYAALGCTSLLSQNVVASVEEYKVAMAQTYAPTTLQRKKITGLFYFIISSLPENVHTKDNCIAIIDETTKTCIMQYNSTGKDKSKLKYKIIPPEPDSDDEEGSPVTSGNKSLSELFTSL